jgi:hypothetical protein
MLAVRVRLSPPARSFDCAFERSKQRDLLEKVKKDQIHESLGWIPRYPETMKGVETYEKLRGVGNKL